MTKLNKLPILNKSEFHYLIDTDEFLLHKDSHEDSLIVYEYTSSLLDISKELILNNIPFSHHISKDVELSYLIIDIEK
jgi:hypothetical protein|tara:strand:+ start:451 stop:684 length:234 start_codon:yes stop_codon:yes gene_type:complete